MNMDLRHFVRALALLCFLALPVEGYVPLSKSNSVRRRQATVAIQRPTASSSLTQSSTTTALSAAIAPTIASALVVAGVIAFHEAGHFFAAKSQGMKIQSFNIGYGPKLYSFNDSSDVEFSLRALPLGGYVSFPANVEYDEETGEEIAELDDPDLLQNRPPLQRALVISGGVLANFLLTFLLATGTAVTSGLGQPVFNDGVLVTTTASADAPAVLAGIRVSDVITKINGEPIRGRESVVNDFVQKIRVRADEPVVLEVVRGPGEGKMGSFESTSWGVIDGIDSSRDGSGGGSGRREQVTVVPRATGPTNKGTIGIGINARVKDVVIARASNPVDAVRIGAEQTVKLTKVTWGALSSAIGGGFTGAGDVSGPISVVKAGAALAQNSPAAIVGFAAALSVNLAVLNSLPFPALDGGQLVFVVLELIAGRPVPRKAKDAIIGLAFGVLLLFGSAAFLGDLTKLGEPVEVFSAARLKRTSPSLNPDAQLPAASIPPTVVDR